MNQNSSFWELDIFLTKVSTFSALKFSRLPILEKGLHLMRSWMSLFHVTGFSLKLLITLYCWLVSSIFSMNSEVMASKTLLGNGEHIVMKLWELCVKIYHCYP